MIPKNWRYSRGDIYYANMEPHVGSEQGGERPVVVLQNDTGNKHSPTLIIEWFVKQGSAAEPLPAAEAGEAGAGAAVQICKPAATGAANLGHGKRT